MLNFAHFNVNDVILRKMPAITMTKEKIGAALSNGPSDQVLDIYCLPVFCRAGGICLSGSDIWGGFLGPAGRDTRAGYPEC